MTDKARAARREYKRRWAKEHPEKIKQYQENYWNKKAAAVQLTGKDSEGDNDE